MHGSHADRAETHNLAACRLFPAEESGQWLFASAVGNTKRSGSDSRMVGASPHDFVARKKFKAGNHQSSANRCCCGAGMAAATMQLMAF